MSEAAYADASAALLELARRSFSGDGRHAGMASPDFAESAIGRRFAPTRWLVRATMDVSHPEQLAVMRLDLAAHLLHGCRIIFHFLDLAERPAPGLFLDLRMH
jgi:hypothetical protein